MRTKKILMSLMALCLSVLFELNAPAQGGWRAWDMYLLDGRRVEANPLGATDDNHLTWRLADPHEKVPRNMIERSKVDYLAARGDNLPPAPKGDFDQDLVIMRDGQRVFGHVTLKLIKYSEGVIVQNKVEINLKNVAYLKFAKAKTDHYSKLLPTAPALLQDCQYRDLTGTVTDESGKALAGAHIEVLDKRTREVIRTDDHGQPLTRVTSRRDGLYNFGFGSFRQASADSKFILRISAPGFIAHENEVDLSDCGSRNDAKLIRAKQPSSERKVKRLRKSRHRMNGI